MSCMSAMSEMTTSKGPSASYGVVSSTESPECSRDSLPSARFLQACTKSECPSARPGLMLLNLNHRITHLGKTRLIAQDSRVAALQQL